MNQNPVQSRQFKSSRAICLSLINHKGFNTQRIYVEKEKKRKDKTKLHPSPSPGETHTAQTKKTRILFFSPEADFSDTRMWTALHLVKHSDVIKNKIAEIHIFFTLHCCGEMFNKLVYNQDKSKGDTGDSDTRCQKNKNLTFAGKIQNLSILDCLVYLTYYLWRLQLVSLLAFSLIGAIRPGATSSHFFETYKLEYFL